MVKRILETGVTKITNGHEKWELEIIKQIRRTINPCILNFIIISWDEYYGIYPGPRRVKMPPRL